MIFLCFEIIMDNNYLVKETHLTAVEKKALALVSLYVGSICLQTRTKLNTSLKNIHYCCKLQIVFKNNIRLGSAFHFKDGILKNVFFLFSLVSLVQTLQ